MSAEIKPANVDWAARGIEWREEDVAKGTGADKTVFHVKAQIPIVVDVDKFRAAVGDAAMLGMLDGSGVRIPAQDVNRREIARNTSAEGRRDAVWSRLIGLRVRGFATPKTVTIRLLLNGQPFNGTTETEFHAANIAAAIDLGMTPDVAKAVAANVKW